PSFSLTPPPPTATLFPYTTLFRSRDQRHEPEQRMLLGAGDPHHAYGLVHGQRDAPDRRLMHRAVVLVGPRSVREQPRDRGLHFADRKSTRLNSSHRTISYAVFCLK